MTFGELKQKQRTMWGAGPFERIEPNLGEMHAAVVEFFDRYCTGDGIRRPRMYPIALGTRR